MLIPMQPINRNTMQRMPTIPIHGGVQEETQAEDQYQFYLPEI